MHFLDAEMQFLNLVKHDQYMEKVISQKTGDNDLYRALRVKYFSDNQLNNHKRFAKKKNHWSKP